MNEMTFRQPTSSDHAITENDYAQDRGPALSAIAPTILIISRSGEPNCKLDDQLRRLGYQVSHLREELDVLGTFDAQSGTVAAVILDWRSDEPKDRGFAEALAYQSSHTGLPVLTLAAGSRVEDIQLALEAGLSKLVTAPCQLGDLKTALDALAKRRRVSREAGDGLGFSDCMALMETCKFRFRTPEDVEQLVPLIARIFPNPERAAPGIFELMRNAIEHGNLEIGFDRKAAWVAAGIYQQELRKRLDMMPYAGRWAEVSINRRTDGVMIVIMDQGCGFCWQDLIANEGAAAQDVAAEPECHGLAKAKRECFDALRFNQFGNQVTAFVAKESLAW
jgi:DNA-binding response OmpR family regulator